MTAIERSEAHDEHNQTQSQISDQVARGCHLMGNLFSGYWDFDRLVSQLKC